ncbi:bifunctional methylenetetrahydrofolate dehydrogenase/methenyltetrahydrofolate cyclohydrolase [Rickettsiales bacterium]|nr:bifunctional methylenetetrahydrofolate dehydrogenase/methenyltetrahydrofolate cyclohydrolase [Rickettsiales bacterium]MDB2550647.1 bifunctional methylenetetrahydrofolate dehydrogenase/methenyltetrahydrofolate cyclohydrolase [Rickettsiales bacterium]
MTVKIIDGKKIANNLKQNIAQEVQQIKQQYNITPTIAVILVGDDPASNIYVSAKEKQAKAIGINSLKITLPNNISQKDLLSQITKLNNDPKIHAILVQLPLPQHINSDKVIETINPDKDVDGFHIINVGKLTIGKIDQAIIPCTAIGSLHLIETVEPDITGKNILVIGSSNIVGMPLSRLLMHKKATVTIANSKTRNLKFLCQNADIIISATGVAGLVTADMIHQNSILIDVGINRITKNDGTTKLIGDIDFDNCSKIAKAITPVPGGVGPMTIAYLLQNCLNLCKKLEGI